MMTWGKAADSLPRLVADWPAYWRELYEERAGIMEIDGNQQRGAAEYWAEQDIRKQFAKEGA